MAVVILVKVYQWLEHATSLDVQWDNRLVLDAKASIRLRLSIPFFAFFLQADRRKRRKPCFTGILGKPTHLVGLCKAFLSVLNNLKQVVLGRSALRGIAASL